MVVLDSKRLEKAVAYHCEMCHLIRCTSVNRDSGGCEGMLAMISHDEHVHLANASVTVPHTYSPGNMWKQTRARGLIRQ